MGSEVPISLVIQPCAIGAPRGAIVWRSACGLLTTASLFWPRARIAPRARRSRWIYAGTPQGTLPPPPHRKYFDVCRISMRRFSLRALQARKWHVYGSSTFGAAWEGCRILIRKGGWYGWKPSSSSIFSIRAFRVYPLIEIRLPVPCRTTRGSSISVNSTLPPLTNARWFAACPDRWRSTEVGRWRWGLSRVVPALVELTDGIGTPENPNPKYIL